MVDINRGIILRFMREALRQFPQSEEPRYSTLMIHTMVRLSDAGLIDKLSDPNIPYKDFARLKQMDPLAILLTEGYQHLLALGYIIPRPEPPNAPSPNYFAITDIGRQWAAGSDPIPEDPKGYMATLDALVPNLDPVIRQYVQEALLTYERRAFFASVVMIGAASERAAYLLMDALLGAISNPAEKKAMRKVIQDRRLPAMFKRLSDYITRAKSSGAILYAVHESADQHLLSLQEAIRVWRNNAVHPQVGQVNPETAHLAIAAFPAAYKKVYDLILWFRSNQV